jgi:hypothetical protein
MLLLLDNVSATIDAVMVTKAQAAPTSFVRADGFPQSLPPGVHIGN